MTGPSKFWSTLITEKGLSPHLESLMSISDLEERGLSMMSRVHFLWSMGIKYQRDILVNILQLVDKELKINYRKCNSCSKIKHVIDNNNDILEEITFAQEEGHLISKHGGNNRTKRKGENYSPEKIKKKLREDKENISGQSGESVIEVLVPETERFSQVISTENEEFIIPETLAIDDHQYGNTDFFNDSEVNELSNSTEAKEENSPVLGKVNKGNATPTHAKAKRSLNLASPNKNVLKSSNFQVNKVNYTRSPDSKIISSPSLLGCDLINEKGDCSQEDGNASISVLKEDQNKIQDDGNIKSNSRQLASDLNKEELDVSPFSPQKKSKITDIKLPKAILSKDDGAVYDCSNLPKKSVSLLRSKSEFGSALPKNASFKGIQSFKSLKNSKLDIEIELGSPNENKKKYRQMKITPDWFFKKTDVAKATGGAVTESAKQKSNSDEDDLVALAVRESIRTKAIEEMLRNKKNELQKSKSKNANGENPKKDESCSSSKVRRSPRKKLTPTTPVSPVAKEQVTDSKSQESFGTPLSEDEILRGLKKPSKPHNDSRGGEKLRRNRRKNLVNDSFDVLPESEEPEFAHKGEVVRKKSERQKLTGWDCHECREYFEARGVTAEERKTVKNKCSRHRSKYKPVTNTPEGFWVVGFDDD